MLGTSKILAKLQKSKNYLAPGAHPGLKEVGNIDLTKRKEIKNPDGSVSTLRSMSINIDGNEVLIPTISNTGRELSETEAIGEYERTKEHLGVFQDPESATEYAKKLSNRMGGLLKKKAERARR